MKVAAIAVAVFLLLGGGVALFVLTGSDPTGSGEVPGGLAVAEDEPIATSQEVAAIEAKNNEIRVNSLTAGDTISSPLIVAGEARGAWFFEASMPVTLLNRNGQTIARGVAQATADWMTEEFVPFTTEINFKSPYMSGDPLFLSHGTVVIRKDNPSGDPANDDSLRIPVAFAPNTDLAPFAISIPEPVVIYDGIEVMSNIQELDVSGRGLTGSLKAEINQLTRLEVLDLSNNDFTGLPAEIGQLTELRSVNLASTSLTGLPYELGQLSKLEELDLRGTQYAESDLEIIKESLPSGVIVFTDDGEEIENEEELPEAVIELEENE